MLLVGRLEASQRRRQGVHTRRGMEEPSSSSEGSNAGKTMTGLNDYYSKTLDTLKKISGAPNPTAPVPSDVTLAVDEIISKGLEGGGPPNDSRVSDIVWGWATDGWYVITVSYSRY